ncbi:hypothetical protein [Halorussus sp. MSC15.2]|uniref:hypothetical protein n=1 Tax=Halorussus sp. MSC15.2 TaxID=2283638 RepID=UPI0013D1A50A|nr:hypothetical protein [Halorussus sp. MSC15.2]NEU59182.1 hypothetical protein [Halorussus sp. MSC15.2]
MTDDTVLERRDATGLETNDEVERTVDEMLDTDDLEAEDVGAAGGTDAPDADPESFDFEGQEWTLDERREPTVFELRDMKFLLEEPENDDAVLNKLEEVAEADRAAQMRALVQLAVAKPDVSDERWEQMAFSAKLALASRAAEFLGLDGGFLDE